MFGFHLLSAKGLETILGSGDELFSKELLKAMTGFDKQVELEDATLIDTHRYQVGDLTYEQKVYRLKDHTIFVDTKNVQDTKLVQMRSSLNIAIKNEDYETAAQIRDQIKEYLKTK